MNGVSRHSTTSPPTSTTANNLKNSSNKFKDLMDTNTELLNAADDDSSDSPSENDSFTCSEYDYEAPPYSAGGGTITANRQPDTGTPGGMVFRKLNGGADASDSERKEPLTVGGLAGWASLDRDQTGSLSTLNVSDDDLSGITSPSGKY